MLLLDGITSIGGSGGEHGKGYVKAFLYLRSDAWFFPCHFQLMPGTLQVDALLQLTGFFGGWRGARGDGMALGMGEVKFRAKVQPTARVLRYNIDIKRVTMTEKRTIVRSDGTVSCDGVVTCTVADMQVLIER